MKVSIICEAGYAPAMLGLSLNRLKDPANMPAVAQRLAGKGQGHDKFLRMMAIYLDVTASRKWWAEMDTYKIGRAQLPDADEGDITTESASTMNNLKDRPLTQADFHSRVEQGYLEHLNRLREMVLEGTCTLDAFKDALPEGYLQRRILYINYAVARDIIDTRSTHRLPEWREFCACLRGLEHAELLEVKP
jgi:hypothetical protein